MTELDEKYLKSENYVNREMSWLEFDFRILGEARDKAIPLFERPGRPIPVLPSPPPCGWSFGFITEPRTVGRIPI